MIKVDFTGSTIDPSTDVLEVKDCIAFEVKNIGQTSIFIESLEIKRGDHQVFTPPIDGAVFANNKIFRFADGIGTKDAVLIRWKALPKDC